MTPFDFSVSKESIKEQNVNNHSSMKGQIDRCLYVQSTIKCSANSVCRKRKSVSLKMGKKAFVADGKTLFRDYI